MATQPTDTISSRNQIQLKQFASPILKSALLVALLCAPTGIYVRKLICTTFVHLTAIVVGILWFIGDIVPTVCLSIMVFDLIRMRRTRDVHLLVIQETSISLLNSITITFVTLYMTEFFLAMSCRINNGKNIFQDCEALLAGFRYVFFNLQILISIIYVTRPWKWGSPDLRRLFLWMRRFNRLLEKFNTSMTLLFETGGLLDRCLSDPIGMTHNYASGPGMTLSTRFSPLTDVSPVANKTKPVNIDQHRVRHSPIAPTVHPDIQPGTIIWKSTIDEPNPTSTRPEESINKRTTGTKRTARKKLKRSARVPTVVGHHQSSVRRGGTVKVTTKRISSRASRATGVSVRQIAVSDRRNPVNTSSRLKTRKRRRVLAVKDLSTRTVNVNLSMN